MKKSTSKRLESLSPKNSIYLWERKSDESLQFWTKGSEEHSLIKPTVPKHLNLTGDSLDSPISAPPAYPVSIFERRGILHAAINRLSANFYTHRYRQKFHFLIYTISGEANVIIGRKEHLLKPGMIMIIPSDSEYEMKNNSEWLTLWFHLKKSKEWNGIIGKKIEMRMAKCLEDLYGLVKICMREVYDKRRSFENIDLYAELIRRLLHRELFEGGNLEERVKRFCQSLPNPSFLAAKEAAKSLGISVNMLDRICMKIYGNTFAKHILNSKMTEAKRMLEAGKSIKETANTLGYADRFAFSKAFKRQTGNTPARYIKI